MAEEDFRALKSMAVASAAKLSATKLGNLPLPPPKAVPANPDSISLQAPREGDSYPAKRQRRECRSDLILSAFEELARSEGQLVTCEMYIPKEYAGLIIGKAGSGIKAIESETGVVVRMQDAELEDGKKLCVVKASSEKCLERARRIINRIIETAKDKRTNEICHEVLEVPERWMGQLIGPKGEFLKRVKDCTGCRCDIDKTEPRGTSEFRKITLSGSFRAVQMGREHLELSILECYRKANVFNAELEEKFKGADERPGQPSALFSADERQRPTSVPVMPHAVAGAAGQNCSALFANGTAASQKLEAIAGMRAFTQVPLAVPPLQSDCMEYFEVVKKWAAFYARDSMCVSHYMSLRSNAARAFCTDLGVHGIA